MTDAERKRAVEVMAEAYWDQAQMLCPWRMANNTQRMPYLLTADIHITALLRIADVKMKDQADDR